MEKEKFSRIYHDLLCERMFCTDDKDRRAYDVALQALAGIAKRMGEKECEKK